jgi:hypothetical protein
MALLTFPYNTPANGPQVGAVRGIGFSTVVTATESGRNEKRRVQWTTPRETLAARWGRREDAKTLAEGIADFHRQTYGAGLAFVAFDCDAAFAHTRVFVPKGTTDGTRTVWNLPCAEAATSVTIYLDGVLQTTGFTVANGGANGRKTVTFSPAPAAGKTITCNFTGQRAWNCRFENDVLELEYDDNALYAFALRLVEVDEE